ncbi:hypothetical protein HAX54_002515 [Datura stramonium]|uniref:Uncharacterized protein n=1 Tax=Datura stramonium TaxID=4076 RepID=A0ABS8T4W7_DATST|nr:hypothetical protein [Datura stramonium]
MVKENSYREFNGFRGALGDGVQGVTIAASCSFFLIEIEYFLVVIESGFLGVWGLLFRQVMVNGAQIQTFVVVAVDLTHSNISNCFWTNLEGALSIEIAAAVVTTMIVDMEVACGFIWEAASWKHARSPSPSRSRSSSLSYSRSLHCWHNWQVSLLLDLKSEGLNHAKVVVFPYVVFEVTKVPVQEELPLAVAAAGVCESGGPQRTLCIESTIKHPNRLNSPFGRRFTLFGSAYDNC